MTAVAYAHIPTCGSSLFDQIHLLHVPDTSRTVSTIRICRRRPAAQQVGLPASGIKGTAGSRPSCRLSGEGGGGSLGPSTLPRKAERVVIIIFACMMDILPSDHLRRGWRVAIASQYFGEKTFFLAGTLSLVAKERGTARPSRIFLPPCPSWRRQHPLVRIGSAKSGR
ncbi:uncharacterized protein LY79DRAFT_200301 [Colletotrichum navitas]|uniref:Uncharacterized protein n=1 Tax=Colletotrichum navitas TaxID=681940 RepID=A0AAD8Q111_9PEZI|nr:uncharacterized protein LY79DRAFT_200301 [Colletotrichum navitas]KAK1590787.1 hypothetical protein LY79DRAFT_200301 [Colletotrichum navitas]